MSFVIHAAPMAIGYLVDSLTAPMCQRLRAVQSFPPRGIAHRQLPRMACGCSLRYGVQSVNRCSHEGLQDSSTAGQHRLLGASEVATTTFDNATDYGRTRAPLDPLMLLLVWGAAPAASDSTSAASIVLRNCRKLRKKEPKMICAPIASRVVA